MLGGRGVCVCVCVWCLSVCLSVCVCVCVCVCRLWRVCSLDNMGDTVPGDFDRFWFFWFLGVVVAVLSGCCAPHQRKIVINRKDDDGYIEGARV